MSKGQIRDDWLLNFEKPDNEVYKKIKAILGQLKISKPVKRRIYNIKNATYEGSLDGLMEKVAEYLEKDHATNKAEETAPYLFDYVVQKDSLYPATLEVLTRLYHPDYGGNVYYGCVVQRIGPESYLLWIDD